MVLCWIALPFLAIMGIFSVRYRKLAVESFDCLFRNVTFRKCRSGFDERIKSDITGRLMKISPVLGRGFYRNYKIIVIIILIITILSFYFSAVGIYNYVMYGNCNGENSNGFCVIGSVEDSLGFGEENKSLNNSNFSEGAS